MSDETMRRVTPGVGYGERVAERLRFPVGVGRLDSPDAVGEAGSAECRGLIRVELAVTEGTLSDARYRAYGCPATLACASEVVSKAQGLSLVEAAAVSAAEISACLGLSPAKTGSAELAVEALHAALTQYLSSVASLVGAGSSTDEHGVLVGMSGGVDSTVAAMLLKRQGYRVVGATLNLWEAPGSGGDRVCCSPETVHRARRAAHSLGIPHLTVDATKVFYEDVVHYFLSEYEAGRTPNPCAKCNSRVRFALMSDLARRLGLSHIATGHYARLTGDPPRLTRGVDQAKDQSYVLAEVSPEMLARVIFPLGELTKSEVRAMAAAHCLEGHGAPESQEICFVPDDDYRRFLRERLGDRPGDIVDTRGRVMGRHSGTYNFTIGQRKGLGLAAKAPLYVVALDADRGDVVIGEDWEASVGTVTIGGLTRHCPLGMRQAFIQVRSAAAPVAARLEAADPAAQDAPDDPDVVVSLEEQVCGVAPGQTAVVYEGERVVFAGTIISTGPSRVPAAIGPRERERTGPVV